MAAFIKIRTYIMSVSTLTICVGWVEERDPTSGFVDVNLQFVINQPDMILRKPFICSGVARLKCCIERRLGRA
ncbi:MAG: hypothetical protein Fur006_17560 [Coleofasciculaceae cyanobacterium]